MAQPMKLPESDSGTNIFGMQLSITMSNSVLVAGHNTSLYAEITNTSTNTITVVETGPMTDFDVLLTTATGKEIDLTPKLNGEGFRMAIRLAPGQHRRWLIPVLITEDIEPGSYALEARRRFMVNRRWFNSASNSLKVQVFD
jgi:hypothetical protein